MKIKGIAESYNINDDLWVFRFNAEDIDKDFVQAAKEIDGENYWDKCFSLRIYYHDGMENEIPDVYADLLYTTNNGNDIELDYFLSDEEQKYVLECIRKEI